MATKLGRVPWFRADGREVERLQIKCDCGQEIVCSGFTNTCDCGCDYNMSGSLLADRSQWGEETGESVQEILSVDAQSEKAEAVLSWFEGLVEERRFKTS